MRLNTKPLAEIEYGMPVLAGNQVVFAQVVKAEVKPNKDKSNNNLAVSFKVVDDEVVLVNGDKVKNRGNIVWTYYIALKPATGNYNPDEKLKELAVALGVPEDKEDFELSDVKGYTKIKTKLEPADGQYQERNSIGRLIPIKDSDNFVPPM